MAEAVGLASSLLALAAAAFKASKSLYEAVSSFRSHRKTIQDLQADLETLSAVLDQVQAQIETTHDADRFETLRKPIFYCMEECQEMHGIIKKCSTHTTEARTSVQDWLNMKYRGKSVEETKHRLYSYKLTISVAFGLITMQSQSTTHDSLEQLKAAIEGTTEELEDQLVQVQRQIEAAEASLNAILQDDRAAIQSCLDSLARSLETANSVRPDISIQDNRAGQGSRTIFGTDTSQPQFNLTVSGNEAQQDAIMGSGVYTPQTLQALLRDSGKGDVASSLQTLQRRAGTSDMGVLQSMAKQLTVERSGMTSRMNPSQTLIESAHAHLAEEIQWPPAARQGDHNSHTLNTGTRNFSDPRDDKADSRR